MPCVVNHGYFSLCTVYVASWNALFRGRAVLFNGVSFWVFILMPFCGASLFVCSVLSCVASELLYFVVLHFRFGNFVHSLVFFSGLCSVLGCRLLFSGSFARSRGMRFRIRFAELLAPPSGYSSIDYKSSVSGLIRLLICAEISGLQQCAVSSFAG